MQGCLFTLKNRKKEEIEDLLRNNQVLLCELAYKNAHEGYPYGIGGNKVALSAIHIDNLNHLIP